MDYGHTAQNGQVAPQFGAMPQGANVAPNGQVQAMPNGQMQAMPDVSAQAAQNFGANAMNAYAPMPGQYPQEQMQYQGQQMLQEQQMSYARPMQSQEQMVQSQGVQSPEQIQMGQQVAQQQMTQPQAAPQMTQQSAAQTAQMTKQNALESLKQGVNLDGGISSTDVAKMDAAIQLLDQMGPAEFYEQFSTVAETTVGNNYGVKVDS
jgi:hypothetical protein